MKRFEIFVRSFLSIFNFSWLIPGMYQRIDIIPPTELPQPQGAGEAIASYWRNVGGYMRKAMDQVETEHSDGQKTQK